MLQTRPKPATCAACPAAKLGTPLITIDQQDPHAVATVVHFTPVAIHAGLEAMYKKQVAPTTAVNHACLLRCAGAAGLKGTTRDAAVHACRQYDHWTTKLVMIAGRDAWGALHASHVRYTDWLGYVSPNVLNGRAMLATIETRDLYDTDRIVEARAHLRRALSWVAGTWPEQLPESTRQHTALQDLHALIHAEPCTIAIDTEFNWSKDAVPGHHPLTLLGLGWRSQTGVHLTQFTPDDDWSVVLPLLARVVGRHTIVFQNAAADVPVIAFNGGPVWEQYTHVEDLMLAHATLYAGWPHDLGYLRSIGGHLNMPKTFREAHEGGAASFAKYNAGDVYETLCLWEDMSPQVFKDKGLTHTYHTLVKLVPVHTRATQQGVAVYKPAVVKALDELLADVTESLRIVEAYTGTPLPMTGKPFVTWLVCVEGVKPVIHKIKKRVTWDKDALVVLRSRYLSVDAEYEQRNPLTIDAVRARIEQGAHPMLEARALYNRAFQAFTHYVLPLVKGDSNDGDDQDTDGTEGETGS